MPVKIGFHISISKSLASTFDFAKERGYGTFQIFTRNPRGWKFKDLSQDDVDAFRAKAGEVKIQPVVAHMPYLPNPASPKDDIYTKTVETLTSEVDRCGRLGIAYLVMHLGSHLGMGHDVGLKRLVSCVNTALSKADNDVLLLLENMAGQANSMGSRFEEIKRIIEQVDDSKRLGVCFDTCHAFAAGYELRSDAAFRTTMNEFRKTVGIDRLKVIHVNDSQGGCGSGLDRHEHIGLGNIGLKGFRIILRSPLVRRLPLILETPYDDRRNDKRNFSLVQKLVS